MKILRAPSWCIIVTLVALTIVPASERPVIGLPHAIEHLLAFGLAGLTFALAYSGRLRAFLPGAVAFALALELSQIPLPTRHARLEDFIVDAAAACLGILVVHGWRYRAGNRTSAIR